MSAGFPLLFYGCSSAHSPYKVDAASAHPSSSYRNITESEKVIELIESLVGGNANAPDNEDEADEADETSADSDGERVGNRGGGGNGVRLSSGERATVTTNDIGVVTPYRAQVLHLRDKMRKRGLGAVRVGTVDDYQGQEEMIIIISTVLGSANPRAVGHNAHGIMASPQRFNVAITRAKALLIIVGDPNYMIEDNNWREMLKYAVDNNSYRGCAHPLLPDGAENDSIDQMAQLVAQAAQRTLLGSGNASLMFPGLGGRNIWAGMHDDVDDDLGWRTF